MTKYPICPPASYVTPTAVGFADSAGDLAIVGEGVPLPVAVRREAVPAPLAGSASQSSIVGPFVPSRDAPIHLQLGGEWTGQVTLQRSTDGGTTRSGVTAGGMAWAVFSGNVNEPIWQESEANTSLYLDIALTSGAVSFRLSQ